MYMYMHNTHIHRANQTEFSKKKCKSIDILPAHISQVSAPPYNLFSQISVFWVF